MSTFERGVVVKVFTTRDGNKSGFIRPSSGGNGIFFNFGEGASVGLGLTAPKMLTGYSTRPPKEGDVVIFVRSANRQGPKAAPWCHGSDWDLAVNQIAERKVYRLMSQDSDIRVEYHPQELWIGTNTDDLRQKYSNIRLDFDYRGGTGGLIRYWFEEKTPDGWRTLETKNDPRKNALNLGRVEKPSMPLEAARQKLAEAKRDVVTDEGWDDEVQWILEGRLIATAYDRSPSNVTMEETHDYQETRFGYADSDELVNLDRRGKVIASDGADSREIDGLRHAYEGSY